MRTFGHTSTSPTTAGAIGEHSADDRSPAHAAARFPVGLSVVLPAYNEEAMIAGTVRHVAAVLRDSVPQHEIVVTNDGSRDGTARVLAELQANEPELQLRIVTHEHNLGYGAALASGFDASNMELIFFTDGDKQFEVGELASFLAALGDGADLIIGYRARRADPLLRLVNAWAWKQLVNGLFGYTARDVDCAFKLFRRAVWNRLVVRSRGATFSAEFLIKARRRGFSVLELPVSHYPRTGGRPTGAHPRVIARAIKDLLLLRLRLAHDLAEAAHTSPPTEWSASTLTRFVPEQRNSGVSAD